jgi:acyl-CoA synthetase (AMP-forming)/AMP-acid ligase II
VFQEGEHSGGVTLPVGGRDTNGPKIVAFYPERAIVVEGGWSFALRALDALRTGSYSNRDPDVWSCGVGWQRPLHRSRHHTRVMGRQIDAQLQASLPTPIFSLRLPSRSGLRCPRGDGSTACGRSDGTTPIGSVGPAIPGVTVKVSDDGELLVRGPNIMRGYWRDPERTAEVLRDGSYATGDLRHD